MARKARIARNETTAAMKKLSRRSAASALRIHRARGRSLIAASIPPVATDADPPAVSRRRRSGLSTSSGVFGWPAGVRLAAPQTSSGSTVDARLAGDQAVGDQVAPERGHVGVEKGQPLVDLLLRVRARATSRC